MRLSFKKIRAVLCAVIIFSVLPLFNAGTDSALSEHFSWLGKTEVIGDYTVTSEIKELDLYSPENFAATIVLSDNEDMGYALYRDPAFRSEIYSFYTGITGSSEIASAVIENAYKNGISFTLAFSLMWAESGFNPEAVNRNASSIDRGLFQLNSKSFPELRTADFFNIQTNAAVGLSYLSYCLRQGENEIVALAIYNAGHYRVSGAGAPLMTLEHISKILDYRAELERNFERYISRSGKIRTDKKAEKNLIPVVDTRKALK